MRQWDPGRVAQAAGARVAGASQPNAAGSGPLGASIDSRTLKAGELFVGLRGERTDGGAHAAAALEAGAWGVLVEPEHAEALVGRSPHGLVLSHPDPLAALQRLAREWRRVLGARGAKVVAVTGSTGKTSTKDILAALLRPHRRVVASPENLNTEIGLPLAVLAAPADAEVLVLEMAMRGPGQIAQLAAIAEPDVGVIVNVGPVHLELLGSLEAIAAAKAELIAGLAPGAALVVPAAEPLLEPHLRSDIETISFGPGGAVELASTGEEQGAREERGAGEALAATGEERGAGDERGAGELVILVHSGGGGADTVIKLRPSFAQAYNVLNLLAAVAAARALGIEPSGQLDVRFSSLRGERLELPGEVVMINDCYNANPMSMRAAIDELAASARARRVAVLGDMLELGADTHAFHREIGKHASDRGVEVLVTVGPLAAGMAAGFEREAHVVGDADAAAELLRSLVRPRDTVLVKGSRGVGLEVVAERLRAGAPAPSAGDNRRGLLAGPRAR
jgi:UDP-N-acetylmuramoyl-tripeptide--D-alanyl-D-alanine ligase